MTGQREALVPGKVWGWSQPGWRAEDGGQRIRTSLSLGSAGAGKGMEAGGPVSGHGQLPRRLVFMEPMCCILPANASVSLFLCFQDLMNREKKNKIPSMQVGFIDAICLQLYEVFV